MAIGLENQRVALDGLEDFAAAGEAERLVEFAGVVEAEDLLGLFGEVFFRFGEESVMGVSEEDGFQVGKEVWFGLDQFCSWAFLLLALLPEFLGGFGDEEGGGEVGERGEKVG